MSAGLREFYEETGVRRQNLNIIHNLAPIEEVFIGSNFKSYKTKYFLANLIAEPDTTFNSTEIGGISWRSYEESLDLIRHYNYEKRTILTNVNKLLTTNNFIYNM
jgi:8-oxo-dGTP pyrophosphatase MutT (NUDIX family)